GAVNLVSSQRQEPHLGASYQIGSFGTHRVTANGRYVDPVTGILLGASTFLDVAKNNYEIDVEIPHDTGKLHPAKVTRFHDGYFAYGVNLEAGVVDRSWAKRLSLQTFTSSYDKELQHNVVMTVPYGEVRSGETVYGATARYDVALGQQVDLE